jgi:hypothetical protein
MEIVIPDSTRAAYVAIVLTINMLTNLYIVFRLLYLDYRDRKQRKKALHSIVPKENGTS